MIEQVREYKIISKIGEGGMGVVYKAFDENLERFVALKAIHPALTTDENIVARFKNEAKVQAGLIHPNIVSLFSFFKENNTYFMVMEFVDGITLRELIRENQKLTEQQALPILLQLLEGLSHAHSMGIVHRDLKPGNILITTDNRVKISDFGIAKVLGDRGLTATGTKMGTIYYMSPEQIRAQKDIDQRSDIYSLGIILYEMLTGRVPFNTETESDFEIMQEIVYKPLESPKKFNPSISDKIVTVFEKMTHKDRELRYITCYQCTEDIKGNSPLDNFQIKIKDTASKISVTDSNKLINRKPINLSIIKDVRLVKKIDNFDGMFRSISLKGEIYTVSFHPDDRMIASGDSSKKIKLWDVSSGQLIRTLEGHNDIVYSVSFSPDGKILASGSADNTIKLWDINSGQLIITLEGHNGSVNSVTFSPDGKILASGSRDKTIKLWDINSGQLIRTLEGHNRFVWSVSFSPDGKILASGSFDNTIKLWDINSGQLI
ncbi:MAG: serine/threonine protein kinase, partial [Ignavibacterium sp.]|nr:serine/threonine protein kinase [Ignavibacterium sp.]MDW8374465.1 serine/threonine-protein kinase [Ignavibacteriales bacterium]